MNHLFINFLVLLIANLAILSESSLRADTIPSPSELDEPVKIESYMGLWFLSHVSLIPRFTFLKDGYCVRAEYKLITDTEEEETGMEMMPKVSFTVTNTLRKGSADGELEDIQGEATNKISTYISPLNGLFFLTFEDMKAVGTYVIQALGPEVNGKYQWALVTDLSRTDAYLLMRDPENATYKTVALAKAKALGLNSFWNKLKSVPQPPECFQ